MMSDKYPVDAMCHIRDLGLFHVVFAFPEKTVPPVLDKHDWYVRVLICNYSMFSIYATMSGKITLRTSVLVSFTIHHQCALVCLFSLAYLLQPSLISYLLLMQAMCFTY